MVTIWGWREDLGLFTSVLLGEMGVKLQQQEMWGQSGLEGGATTTNVIRLFPSDFIEMLTDSFFSELQAFFIFFIHHIPSILTHRIQTSQGI